MVSHSCSGIHFTKTLVALDLQILLAELHDVIDQLLPAVRALSFVVVSVLGQ